MNGLVVDDFAGAGGWDVGLRLAGHTGQVVGYEWDHAACRTAVAAGHARVRCDIAEAPSWPLAGKVDGYLSSPPCQAWSSAGKGGGQQDQPRIFAHLAACIRAGAWVDYPRDGWHDDRSPLVLEVVRRIDGLRPRWVACEQVPEVLPFWREVARWLRGQGYSAWCGILNSADYGVPQTRRRAILVARRDGIPATSPDSTHSREGGDDLFGSTERWVSMAEALGWGLPERPAWTVSAGGAATGGAEVFANAACRAKLRDIVMYGAGRTSGESAGVVPREPSEPSATITGKGTAAWVLRTGNNSVKQRRGGSNRSDDGVEPYERSCDRPAPTLDTNVGSKWRVAPSWTEQRPATTVQGDPRIGRPGHKDRAGGESQFDHESVRVTVQEAGVLQSFPADYPWTGTKTQKYQQAGNAIPPRLAAAIVAPLLNCQTQAVAA